MAYNEFTIETVQQRLGVIIEDADLFFDTESYPLDSTFVESLKRGATLALAINTEKGKSEFIIAPILLEIKQLLHDELSIFSGIRFDVDEKRGLNGVCDFIISKDRRQHLLSAPVITIVEAKNDNLRDGTGQCIAEMVAAQQFNRMNDLPISRVYGIVTIGSSWKFLQLQDNLVTLDLQEYFINTPQKIVGILMNILKRE